MKTIGFVAARFLAVIALLRVVSYVAMLPTSLSLRHSIGSSPVLNPAVLGYLFAITMLLVAAGVLWANADRFGPSVEESPPKNVRTADIRRLAFAVLGAYLALSSLGEVIENLGIMLFLPPMSPDHPVLRILGICAEFCVGVGLYLANRKPNLEPVAAVANWPRSGEDE